MYQTIKPPVYLRKYIECFWLGEDESISYIPNSHHSIANSKIELLFFCDGIYSKKDKNGSLQKIFKAGFYGQATDFDFYFASSKKTRIFGIRFLPIASLTLFKLPASELTSERIDVTSILRNQGTELAEQIYGAQTFEQKARIATEFFSNRVKELHLKYQSVEKVILKIEQTNISLLPQMVSQSYLSQRQFERHFKELTGFSARTYLKLKRFEQFVETASILNNASEEKLIDIALEVGYYDQAHLNRHFKEFTGVSPTAYFRKIPIQ